MKATWSDLDEEYELATLLLNGNAPFGIPTYQIQHRTIKRWIDGEIREWEIGAEDIQQAGFEVLMNPYHYY